MLMDERTCCGAARKRRSEAFEAAGKLGVDVYIFFALIGALLLCLPDTIRDQSSNHLCMDIRAGTYHDSSGHTHGTCACSHACAALGTRIANTFDGMRLLRVVGCQWPVVCLELRQ